MKNIINEAELKLKILNLPQEVKNELLLKNMNNISMSDFFGYKKVWDEDVFYIAEPYSFPKKISTSRGAILELTYIFDNSATYHNKEGDWFVDVIFSGGELVCISSDLLLEVFEEVEV